MNEKKNEINYLVDNIYKIWFMCKMSKCLIVLKFVFVVLFSKYLDIVNKILVVYIYIVCYDCISVWSLIWNWLNNKWMKWEILLNSLKKEVM